MSTHGTRSAQYFAESAFGGMGGAQGDPPALLLERIQDENPAEVSSHARHSKRILLLPVCG
jgi:hypothetical protein